MHIIRKAEAGDRDLLAELIRTAFRDVATRFGLTPENAPTHPSHCDGTWISAAMEKGVAFFVAETETGLVGCVGLEMVDRDKAYLERLAVLPGFRGQGLGRSLVRHVLAKARERGARRVEIGVIADQAELIEFYRQEGFEVTGTRRFPHLPFQVAFMAVDLGQPDE